MHKLLLFFITLLPLFSAPIVASAGEDSKPNILFIAVDDLNDWVAPWEGHPDAVTPNFDRLADGGMRFTNAHTPAPLCGPARAATFTGLYPSTSGIYLHVADKNIQRASKKAAQSTFLTHYFAQNGYKTMGAGKLLHGGAGGDLLQEFVGHNAFGPYPPQNLRYENKGTSTDWGPYPASNNEMPDYHVASYAVEQLKKNHGKPFFLTIGFNRPHVPWHVPQEWFDRIDLNAVALPPYLENDLDDAPAISRRIHEMPPTPSTEWLIRKGYWKEVIQAYLACVAFMDNQLGRVLDALESSPYADNTIIVLWSDHGYHLGEKNIVAKMTLYEESTRVPLIIAGPNINRGARSSKPVGLIDLYPTLVELAGLPPAEGLDGRSIAPLMADPEMDWNYPAITFWGQNNTSVRTETYRYIQYENGAEELYDHTTDPHEWNNLASDPTTRELRARLRQHIPQPQLPMSRVSHFKWNPYWKAQTRAARNNVYKPD